jgi:predicted kinase
MGLSRELGAVRFTLDEWMTRLFSPDRPASGLVEWYVERAARCIEQIWSATERVVATGTAVILEIGLLQRAEREQFYERIKEAGVVCTLYVVDAARDVRRARVMKRNEDQGATFAMVVPAAIFELASDRWQPPDDEECRGRDVRFVRTDTDVR